jgi:signal transduction histidine kinase
MVAVLAIIISLLVGWQVTALLRRQQATIQAQLAELDRRNQELDSFTSRVAHDLVSPISPLKGYLTLIRRSNSIVDPQVREMLALAEASAARMAEMVEALLRFCRAGRPSEPTVGELDTAVSAILLEVGQTTAKEGVELKRLLDAHVLVACPSQLLQSIAQNLLSNAVKYTAGRPDPRVTVRVWKEADEGVLEVSDNGRGMSPATQQSLFQPFFRAPEARGLPGHGLGLATTKRLVEAHGGTISVVSELGVGTQLTVRFPLVPAPTGSDPEAIARSAPPKKERAQIAAEGP